MGAVLPLCGQEIPPTTPRRVTDSLLPRSPASPQLIPDAAVPKRRGRMCIPAQFFWSYTLGPSEIHS